MDSNFHHQEYVVDVVMDVSHVIVRSDAYFVLRDFLKLLMSEYLFVSLVLLTVWHAIKMQLLNQSNVSAAYMDLLF